MVDTLLISSNLSYYSDHAITIISLVSKQNLTIECFVGGITMG